MIHRLAAVLATSLIAVTAATPAFAWQVTWLGHAGFLLEAKNGTRVLVDPWLQNPRFPKGYNLTGKIDAILVTHGHSDHSGSATELSRRFKAPIIGSYELTSLLQPKEGPQGMGGNVGGSVTVQGISIAMIPAVHSSSVEGEGGKPQYAGAPVGFVLSSPGEPTLVHAGDTGVTRDFETVRDLFHPAIALLPIGGHFTMDPRQAAMAAKFLGVTQVVPMHYGTFPPLKGTPAQLRTALGKSARVHELTPGKATKL